MLFNWAQKRNSILADEMGLGKTVQVLTFLDRLRGKHGVDQDPFLVVAPLSTIHHWRREADSWTGLYPVVYHGNADARERIRKFDFYNHDGTVVLLLLCLCPPPPPLCHTHGA